jgi:Family of unknown function (DUF6445)
MINYVIPTTVIDNFFDDPLWVRDFALKQEYFPDPHHKWPGKRSKPLHELDTNFFNHTVNRFLSVFYNLKDTHIEWDVGAHFQRVSKDYLEGWVHSDRVPIITGIVYLNLNNSPNAGTTIYTDKTPGVQQLHNDKRDESFKNPETINSLEQYRKENNDQFEESIVLKNKFNRLVAFDSPMYHSANNFITEDNEDRLTLVFFINRLVADHFPLQRMIRS